MTTTQEARTIAGSGFDDMTDSEILNTLQEIERLIRRPLRAGEGHYLRDALVQMRASAQRKAGTHPDFVPEMYDSAMPTQAERALDSGKQGEPV